MQPVRILPILLPLLLSACVKEQPQHTVQFNVTCHHCYVAYNAQWSSGDRLWLLGDTAIIPRDSIHVTGPDTTITTITDTLPSQVYWQHTAHLPTGRPLTLYALQGHNATDTLYASIVVNGQQVRSGTLPWPGSFIELRY